MRHCSDCGYSRAWPLADGRFKCRRCGRRYTWTLVWDASRLSAANKHKLVDYFVLGVPSYRARFRGLASPPTIERFFRLIRAVLAFEEQCREPFQEPVRCDNTMFKANKPSKRGPRADDKLVVLGIRQCNGLVRIFPVQGRSSTKLICLVRKHTRPGNLYYIDDRQAYAPLAVHGDQVVFGRETGPPKGRTNITAIEGFWNYTKHWLAPYHGVPFSFAHLYLGEVLFRFNHRDEDLLPSVLKLMKKISTAEIDPLLVRNS